MNRQIKELTDLEIPVLRTESDQLHQKDKHLLPDIH